MLVNIFVNLFCREKLLEMISELDTNEDNYDFLQPSFASHLIFEVHNLKRTNEFLRVSQTGKKFIRVLYNGKIIRKGFDKQIKYDEELDGIPLSNFKTFFLSRIDQNYKKLECKKNNGDDELLKMLKIYQS